MKIVALFSFRYDKVLVPGLLKNIENIVDDVIFHDDTENTELFYNEGEIRRQLVESAKTQNFDYALCLDPDERLEKNSEVKIRQLIEEYQGKFLFDFEFRELWSPNAYRIDGIWGQKKQCRLFPLLPNQKFINLPVHCPWHPINSDYLHVDTGLNLYHLKHIDYQAGQLRRKLYKHLDPNRKIQKIGYDYLTDESDIKLENISEQRYYIPPYDPSINISETIAPLSNYREKKKVLITNHHLENYAGSELVIFELSKEFQSRGWDVYVATFVYGGNMKKLFEDHDISVFNILNEGLLTKKFDLIWSNHFPVLAKCLLEDKIKTRRLIVSSLSSFLAIERINLFEQQADLILFNCYENKENYLNEKKWYSEKVHVFHNSVPSEYFLDLNKSTEKKLNEIAVISNHPPLELKQTVQKLRGLNFSVEVIGLPNNSKLVTKNILQNYDLVITIGRTVQHCFALGIPVYIYDHFGGPGWVNQNNIADVEYHNYSGRCYSRKLEADEITQEILDGYNINLRHLDFLHQYADENYNLPKNLDQILSKIELLNSEQQDENIFVSYETFSNLEATISWSTIYREYLSHSQNLSHSLATTQNTLAIAQNTLATTQANLSQHEIISQKYCETILVMENSKFWKLRNLWFKIKNKLLKIQIK